ncbi:MAG TPA: hypothetical protein VGC24_08185, partial [Burkholderiaceae bacterium]
MLLQKTDKARAELAPGTRTLGLRERSVLLMADGNKPQATLDALFGGEGEHIVAHLLTSGYLAAVTPPDTPAPEAPEPTTTVTADRFDGRRSLATTRMFLF